MKIKLLEMYTNFYKDKHFGTHHMLFNEVILVYSSWDILR